MTSLVGAGLNRLLVTIAATVCAIADIAVTMRFMEPVYPRRWRFTARPDRGDSQERRPRRSMNDPHRAMVTAGVGMAELPLRGRRMPSGEHPWAVANGPRSGPAGSRPGQPNAAGSGSLLAYLIPMLDQERAERSTSSTATCSAGSSYPSPPGLTRPPRRPLMRSHYARGACSWRDGPALAALRCEL